MLHAVMGGCYGGAARVGSTGWSLLLLGVAALQSCGEANRDSGSTSGGRAAGGGDSGGAAPGASGASNGRGGAPSSGGAEIGGAPAGDGGAEDAAGAAGEIGTGGRGPQGSGGANAAGSGGSGGSGGQTVVGRGGSAGDASKCTAEIVLPEPVQPVLEFLLDTSGSMLLEAPGTGSSKYEVTSAALSQAFAELPDGTGAGLIFYPNVAKTNDMPCIVRQEAVPIGTLDAEVREALREALAAKRPSGSTPTHDAVVYAIDKLAAASVDGPKHLVLLTDGAPTYALGCEGDGIAVVDSMPLVEEVERALLMFGIRTFVIGSPGSEDVREPLSRMATVGGTALPGCSDQGPTYCHLDMTVAADLAFGLTTALRDIAATTSSCSYRTPPNLDRSKVNVAITKGSSRTFVPMSTSFPCTSGWQYSASYEQIELCPDTCQALKADPAAYVELSLGCSGVSL